jgi:energy-coupling factor transport system substrate-specific component
MRSVVKIWKYPQMIVLVAVCAALYGTAVSVFRLPPPLSARIFGQLLPLPIALMFGPAAPWAIAFGDLIGECVTGNLSFNSIFGFIGNFVLGLLPYLMWTRLAPLSNHDRMVDLSSIRQIFLFVLVALGSGFSAAVLISWPLDLIGVVPYSFLVNLIGIQDSLLGIVSFIFLRLIYHRVETMGLLYWDIMDESDLDNPEKLLGVVGAWIVLFSALGAWLLGGLVFTEQAQLVASIGTLSIITGIALIFLSDKGGDRLENGSA